MKKLFFFCGFLLLGTAFTYAQDCKVLLKPINKSYTGDCKKGKAEGKGTAKGIDNYVGDFKKGLPNGEGTYVWANGDTFTGIFSKGKKAVKVYLLKRIRQLPKAIGKAISMLVCMRIRIKK